MVPIINLLSENVQIAVSTSNNIKEKYNMSTTGAIVQCIKHVYRYGSFVMPKDIMVRILWLAHKGSNCEIDHLDIAQRLSLYKYLKNKDFQDPYLLEFVKQTKEDFKHALL